MINNPISYPGNKNKVVSQIIPLMPETRFFVDVFCGSAVVSANSPSETLILNDNNQFILQILKYQFENSFEQIVGDIEKIIDKYGLTYSRIKEKGFYVEKKHEGLSLYNKKGYELLKNDYNQDHDVKKLFVLLIYGFNHYLRFNSKGLFNVPVGKVDFSESIYIKLRDFEAGFRKKKIVFSNKDFRTKELYKYDDAIYYFDPPYLVTTAPYNSGWNEKQEKELLSLLDELNEAGRRFALSNVLLSNGKENLILKEWSAKYKVHYIKRQYRNANYQKVNVTDTIEVLITNF